MANEETRWTEDQIAEAFRGFHNSNSGVALEQTEQRLRMCLQEVGEGPFGPEDVLAVSLKLVPSHCAAQMARVVMNKLQEQNAGPVTVH